VADGFDIHHPYPGEAGQPKLNGYKDQKKHPLGSDQWPVIGAPLEYCIFVLSDFCCLGAPLSAGRGNPTSGKPLHHI
jgi:hypothetical protein